MRQVMFSKRWAWKHAVALVLFGICVAGGWWQIIRAESPTGTMQNLGYALEWPVFALFVVFCWFRMMQLEARQLAKGDHPRAATAPAPEPPPAPVVLVKRTADTEADPELDAYNDYLAWLAKQND